MTSEPTATSAPPAHASAQLLRQVGLFDATMIVMGGIVGAGIFINPYVVARAVHTPVLILAAWTAGGVVALLGAFVYAELAARMPDVGGQYAYLRDAFHPIAGFLYGWVLLLVIQTGGMAAVTVTFARYFLELTNWPVSERLVAVVTIVLLTLVNCLGVRAGSRVQSILMLLKIGAIATLIFAGLFLIRSPFPVTHPVLDRPPSLDLVTSMGAAMVPVLFAFGGWQTANFIAAEIKDPTRNLSRALLMGVAGVIALYLGVNFVCVRALGAAGLAESTVPASSVMRMAMGNTGCATHRFGNRSLDPRLSQPVRAHRAARLFRHGARRTVLPRRCAHRCQDPCAGGGHHSAKRIDTGHCALRQLRENSQLRRLHGFHLLRTHRRQYLCISPPRSAPGS